MVAGSVMSAAAPGAPAWDVVIGDRFIAAIAAPAPDTCTSALAAAAGDERVSVESLVGRVPLGGADAVDSFAIVWWPGADTSEVTAVVRGDAVVDLTSPGGTRRFDARGIRPWHLAEFGAVISLRVTAADTPLDRLGEAVDHVVHAHASLRVSAIEWSSVAPQPRRPDASVADADTILMPRGRTGGPPPPGDRASTPALDGELAGPTPHVIGAALRGVAASADVEALPHPPAARDGSTAVRSATGSQATERPAATVAPARAPTATPPDVPAFRIGEGAPHPVTGPVLIGRRPLAPRIPDPAGGVPELVAVASPHAVVSGTHLELRVEGTRLVATDLRSTNGTIVRSASGSRRMRAGESIVVAPGTSLDLGDDTIIEILPAPQHPSNSPFETPDRQQAAP
jgi:FHA domain